MQAQRYRIRFPSENLTRVSQHKSHFSIIDDGHERAIGFHDYDIIYSYPGLYEQLFYERLQCNSPKTVVGLLHKVAREAGDDPGQFRVLDFGAGNGMVGELLVQRGSARVVGIDIIAEAAEAADRDRPGSYDAYYVADVTQLDEAQYADLRAWRFNALTTVAALGFGDIPVAAFREAYNLVSDNGWIAFNIKESFLATSDQSGFSRLIKRLLYQDYLKLYHLERYRHRLSIEGRMLHYDAIIGRKCRDIDDACIADIG